ncbi:MAG: hypothetical protein SFY95_08070, partial [Planctomycetota bacterium]|nr:hypothetical protein [Planctomycetota bacterium]
MRTERKLSWMAMSIVAAWFAGVACGAPPVGEFVRDVSRVAGPGSPGTLVAFTPAAVPVVLGQVENGAAFAPVIVAAEWERGRVVAFA